MNQKNNMDAPSDRNSCCDILRSDFRNAMLLHDNTRPWHYGVDLSNKDDPNSLSQYLKLTNKQYEDLLVISGLGRKVKYGNENRFEMLFGEWVQFLVSIIVLECIQVLTE